MILGVPTLNRYDLLGKLIASAEAGTLKPSAYLVVDNGGRFNREAPGMPGVAAALARGAEIWVLATGRNLGVAASWNAILDEVGPASVAISNDDIELGQEALEALDRASRHHDFVIAEGGPNANGWCLFTQSVRCTALVGPYDENFYPAYYEDSDYEQRLRLAGIVPHYEPTTLHHYGWATMRVDTSGKIAAGQQRCAEYFQRKWGGTPRFSKPFDGVITVDLRKNPKQTGWKMYSPPEPMTMRWDVINHVAKTVGAKFYLEVGVSNGENLRRVDVPVKWGVDPEPQLEAVKASHVFVPRTSDDFFENVYEFRFDVAFIDGLHHSDQAYRDIINAARIARVVVVHDANPSTEAMQRVPYSGGDWTGDVWKAIARIRAEGVHLVRTIDTDFGVAVVIPNRGAGPFPGLPCETWEDLQIHREELLGLISVSEWKAWFAECV